MKIIQGCFYQLPILLVVFLIFSFQLPAKAGTPATTPVMQQPVPKTVPTIQKPKTTLRKPTIATKPAAAIKKIGYCCSDGKVTKVSQAECSKKRGAFSSDQRSAVKTCMAEKGYCCKDGEVNPSTRGNCTKVKGAFFTRQDKARISCAATKGFCCNEGDVSASTKGSCDKNQGNFFMKQQDAQNECAKKKGFCLKEGAVSSMTKGNCERRHGLFFLTQPVAKRALGQERGYCCTDGKILSSTRKNCELKKGSFSLNRATAVKQCTKRISSPKVASSKPANPIQSDRSITMTRQGTKAITRQPVPQSLQNGVKDTSVNNAMRMQGSQTLTLIEKGRQIETGIPGPVTPADKLTGQPSIKEGRNVIATLKLKDTNETNRPSLKTLIPLTGPGLKKDLIPLDDKGAAPTTDTPEFNPAASPVPISNLELSNNPLVFIYFDGGEFKYGPENTYSSHGVLEVRNATLTVTCGSGSTLDHANLFVFPGYSSYNNVDQLLDNTGQHVFSTLKLMDWLEFLKDFDTTPGKPNIVGISFLIEKFCKAPDGTVSRDEKKINLELAYQAQREAEVTYANNDWSGFLHSCTSGFKIEESSEQRVISNHTPANPKNCVRIPSN